MSDPASYPAGDEESSGHSAAVTVVLVLLGVCVLAFGLAGILALVVFRQAKAAHDRAEAEMRVAEEKSAALEHEALGKKLLAEAWADAEKRGEPRVTGRVLEVRAASDPATLPTLVIQRDDATEAKPGVRFVVYRGKELVAEATVASSTPDGKSELRVTRVRQGEQPKGGDLVATRKP